MLRSLVTALTLGSGLSLAAPTSNASSYRLLVGTAYRVQALEFNVGALDVSSTTTVETVPSWALLGDNAADDSPYYAVAEYTTGLSVFSMDATSGKSTYSSPVNGSKGVVHLAYNDDQTRVVGAAYASGNWDVYDTSDANKPTKMKTLNFGPEGKSNPHQSILDPTGRYFVIPDLGLNQIHIVDTKDDSYEVATSVDTGKDSGPRHGVFVTQKDAEEASHFILITEVSSEVVVYEVTYADKGLELNEVQRVPTWGDANPPASPEPYGGEIQIASNMRDVYVSTRNTAAPNTTNPTDPITHFKLDTTSKDEPLAYADTVSTGGVYPRMFSLSKDEKFLFSVNQGGDQGVVVLGRCGSSGKLTGKPVAGVAMNKVVNGTYAETANGLPGPMFVQQI